MKKLVLIDGHSILNRAFYGVPDLSNSKGLHTNAIYGFLNIMFKILDEEKPDYLAVAFDVKAPTFRHKIYEQYKGTRKPMPDELREQVPVMKDVLRAMNVVIVEQAGLEADDILGTLAKRAEADGMEVALVSGDRDLLQIATDVIKIRIPKTKMGRTEIEDYYAADVERVYQVTPLQFIELKALMGDTSDNIPGVPKIGEKTATSLMVEYGSIENIYAQIDSISKKSVKETLQNNRELADLSKVLATIKTDCDFAFDYEAAKAENYFTKEAYQFFKQLEFKNMLSRFEQSDSQTENADLTKGFHMIKTQEDCVARLQEAGRNVSRIGMIILTQEDSFRGLAFTVSDKESYFYYNDGSVAENQQLSLFSMEQEDCAAVLDAIRELSANIAVSTFDNKRLYPYVQTEELSKYFDVIIGSYLLNPLKNDYDAESVAQEFLGLTIQGAKEFFGKKTLEEMAAENLKALGEYYMFQSYVAYAAEPVLKTRLEEVGMLSLMTDIEMPLSYVLYDMEQEGITVRKDELKEYSVFLGEKINELEKKIFEQAGVEFNINSPKQLGEILFEKLAIPGAKKTKTGYSTAADVLEKLAVEYPIVNDILEYRGLAKLKSTYADGLTAYIREDNRIHTNFNQTITATGRISSTEPNLQNIPIRMELGRKIRKAFVASEGCVLTDADYSQIELRVLAHLSGDEELIAAYKSDQDIHRITASKVFNTPLEEVTPLQRRNAKAVNFGIVYGISSFGLSQDLSISRKEAAEYIEQYFATYPKVKAYLDKLVADAKESGYITTMFGRRRPIPELGSSNFMQRSFGERVAMNSPIQGTAADIIKIAMIKVWKSLKEAGLSSKLILQVHDELVIETKVQELDAVKTILEKNMREAADLAVDLAVDLQVGPNWYEAH